MEIPYLNNPAEVFRSRCFIEMYLHRNKDFLKAVQKKKDQNPSIPHSVSDKAQNVGD